jgi:hypothetical protein
METLVKEVVFPADKAAKMTKAQEMLFAQLVEQYWEEAKAEAEARAKVQFDNLVFVAQVKCVMAGWM